MKYKIYDWAGNEMWALPTFDTFEDAWDYIVGELTDKLGLTEDDYQEYVVKEVGEENSREKRYLDPFDPRGAK